MSASIAAPILGTACGVAFAGWAVRGRASSVFGPSVHRGPADRKAIALTFDDGPSDSTLRLLELLARHETPATFFQIGANVERLPDIARQVHAAGHEIGNHSHTHPLFCFHSPEFIYREFARAQETIAAVTGSAPAWLRAPFGVRWFGFRQAQRRLGLRGVMWTAIGYDWKLKADTIVGRMLPRVTNGAILCLHDGREVETHPDIRESVAAVGLLIPRLRDQGYKFETVSRLLCPMN
ncbi:MAG TPA: polysaccharide deacetylase family protein [Bryobacteraceae bacterium]|nr:polysaccharide deacetylase family protein [Bryobacteraceae bacterium]